MHVMKFFDKFINNCHHFDESLFSESRISLFTLVIICFHRFIKPVKILTG